MSTRLDRVLARHRDRITTLSNRIVAKGDDPNPEDVQAINDALLTSNVLYLDLSLTAVEKLVNGLPRFNDEVLAAALKDAAYALGKFRGRLFALSENKEFHRAALDAFNEDLEDDDVESDVDTIKPYVLEVLEAHDSKCLDNAEERETIALAVAYAVLAIKHRSR